MRKFWAEFISSLYSIKDGIVKKKQENEAEKEELRNQIAELQQNSNNSQESVIVEPFAMFQNYDADRILKPFDKSFIDYSPALALYKIEDFEQTNDNSLSYEDAVAVDDVEVNNNLSLKDNKIYFLQISSRRLYFPNSESAVYAQFLDTNQNGSYSSYKPRPFVQNGQAFDFVKSQDYTISLESLQIEEGLEVEDLYNLYFIVGVDES